MSNDSKALFAGWLDRFRAIADVPDAEMTEQALYDAEEELGADTLPMLIDRIPLSDLRALAESADRSSHFALLDHLSPRKLAELLDYQMRHEKLYPDAFSPFENILFGTFFREDIQDNRTFQEDYLDAIFDHRLNLVVPLLRCLLDAFSSGDHPETNPFVHTHEQARMSDIADSEEDLGIFTHWYQMHHDQQCGEYDDAGPRAFLLCICALRPEFALTLSDLFKRQPQGEDDGNETSTTHSPATLKQKPATGYTASESMF